MCVQGVSGGKKCSFFGKFSVLCFLETLVLRFGLLPYYRLDHIRILALFLFFEQLVNSNR